MTLGERVRLVRTELLGKISQTEFAEKLGVSRSEIANLEGDLLKKPEGKMPLLLLICEKYSINKEWLLTGEGQMALPVNETDIYIDELVHESNSPFPALIRKILIAYAEAEPNDRPAIDRFVQSIFEKK